MSAEFPTFTADQWKNWTIVYSLVALKDILPPDHYDCWSYFVQACQYLSSRAIHPAVLNQAHSLLVRFCQCFEALYGSVSCTMNMHLHCHLAECVREHGPVYSFWLFSFERYNGILGAIHTNIHAIEVQMMRKKFASQQLWSMMESTDLSSVDFVQMLQDYNTERGTAFELTSIYEYFATLENDDVKGRYVELLPPLKERVLNHLQLPFVESSHRSLLSPNYVRTLRIYKSASQARIRGELYGCAHSRNKKQSIALVRIRTCDGTNLEDTLWARFNLYV